MRIKENEAEIKGTRMEHSVGAKEVQQMELWDKESKEKVIAGHVSVVLVRTGGDEKAFSDRGFSACIWNPVTGYSSMGKKTWKKAECSPEITAQTIYDSSYWTWTDAQRHRACSRLPLLSVQFSFSKKQVLRYSFEEPYSPSKDLITVSFPKWKLLEYVSWLWLRNRAGSRAWVSHSENNLSAVIQHPVLPTDIQRLLTNWAN